MLVLAIITVLVLVVSLKMIAKFIVSYFELKKLPGPPQTSLLLGNIPIFHTTREKIFTLLRELCQSYYPVFSLKVLHVIAVNIQTPEDCELVLSNPKHNEKEQLYQMFHTWLKTGLLTSTGEKWMQRRKILTPAFHFDILRQFIPIYNEETANLVEVFKKECHKDFIVVNPHVTQYTLKTIVQTAMGTKLELTTKEDIEYEQAIKGIGKIYVYRLLHTWFVNNYLNCFSPKWFRERRLLKVLHNFSRKVIGERRRHFQNPDKKRRLAMLDLLLASKMDDEGIQEEVDTFTFEGHDTTSAALSFALMLLACNPDVQNRVVEEMGAVLDTLSTKPTLEDLQELKYMDQVLREVLRLYPSVHFIGRKLGEGLTTHNGYYLPEGSSVIVHIYDLHRNPQVWEDPDRFDPDRFLPENCAKRHPFAHLPFSAGPRNCIGKRFAMLELKAALCGILAEFVLEPVDTPETIVIIIDIILRTKDGIKVKFVPRNKTN